MLEYVDEGKTGDLFRAARQDAEMKAKWQSHVWFFRRISLHADLRLKIWCAKHLNFCISNQE